MYILYYTYNASINNTLSKKDIEKTIPFAIAIFTELPFQESTQKRLPFQESTQAEPREKKRRIKFYSAPRTVPVKREKGMHI